MSVFAESLSQIAAGILVWEKAVKELVSKKQTAANDPDPVMVMSLLRELAQALKAQKGDEIDSIMEQIAQQPLDDGVKTAMDQITDEVLVAEYEKAGEILENLIKERNDK